MLGLLTWHDATGDAAALAAAPRIGDLLCDKFLGAKTPRLVDTGSTEMNLAPVHVARAALPADRREAVPRPGEQIVERVRGRPTASRWPATTSAPPWPARSSSSAASRAGRACTRSWALAELSRITGDGDYRKAFEQLWWSIAELDRHNNGGFSSGEQAQGNPYHPGRDRDLLHDRLDGH